MNRKTTIRSDDVLRLKIIILICYLVLTAIVIISLGESGIPLVSQLILQLGAVQDGAPLQVQP